MDVRVPSVIVWTTFQFEEGDAAGLSVFPENATTEASKALHEPGDLLREGSPIDSER